MRVRQVVGLVVGSWLVSLACASPAIRDAERDAGRRLVDSAVELVEDVLELDTSVADAKADDAAAPLPAFTVDEVPCTTEKPWMFGATGLYAEKSYPGRSMADLARAAVLVCQPSPVPADYPCSGGSGVLVRDGSIAYFCGTKGDAGPTYASVKFIVPR